MREPSKLPVVSPDTSALGAAKQHVTRTATGPSVSPRTVAAPSPSAKRAPPGGYADAAGDRWQELSKTRCVPVVSWPHASERRRHVKPFALRRRKDRVEHPRVPCETMHGAMPLHGTPQSPAEPPDQKRPESASPAQVRLGPRFRPSHGFLRTRTPSCPCHSADDDFVVLS